MTNTLKIIRRERELIEIDDPRLLQGGDILAYDGEVNSVPLILDNNYDIITRAQTGTLPEPRRIHVIATAARALTISDQGKLELRDVDIDGVPKHYNSVHSTIFSDRPEHERFYTELKEKLDRVGIVRAKYRE